MKLTTPISFFARTRAGEKSGTRGDDFSVTFAIDGGITPDAQATFNDGTGVLAIKVKADDVLWSAVETAVAFPVDWATDGLANAFSLLAEDPTAEVGASIGSVTATLAGGVDDEETVVGAAHFLVGDHDSDVSIGDRFPVFWDGELQRWVICGGAGGNFGLIFGKTTETIPPAEDWDLNSAGEGEFQPLGTDGLPDGAPITIKNRYFDEIPANTPGFVTTSGVIYLGINFGCNTGPT